MRDLLQNNHTLATVICTAATCARAVTKYHVLATIISNLFYTTMVYECPSPTEFLSGLLGLVKNKIEFC